MYGARLLLAAAALQTVFLAVSCGHRRSVPTQATVPASKSGWRPVVGSGGILYSFGGPIHAPSYKIPVPVLEYQSSARPLPARDATKLTSIAQSYRPTTIRTVAAQPTAPHGNQPINSYHNPYVFNNGLSYKYVQNIPLDNSFVRNTHNYNSRPVYSKYPAQHKFKQPAQNNVLQQLTSIQPVHFGHYQTPKPVDIFGKPVEGYVRPNDVKAQSASMEIFKPEVYKLPDTNTASQSVNQQVKTAQQQNLGPQTFNQYPQYSFQDAALPHSVLGAFGNFGQNYNGHNLGHPSTKQPFSTAQPQKQTIFNSFSYNPNYKSTSYQFISTTPRLQTTANFNNNYFVSTLNDFKVTPSPPSAKVATVPKIDPNAGAKDSFKASPQDPFNKKYPTDFNKVTTYSPVQTTTLANALYEYSFPAQQVSQLQHYFDQQNYDYEKKQKVNDNVASSVNQYSNQYENPLKVESEPTLNSPNRPTYEVIETTEPEVNTHTTSDYDTVYSKPTTTASAQLSEEYAVQPQPDKGFENSLSYDGQIESQSQQPFVDDLEPIGKHKLKDYYYRVSTPAYNEYNTKRTKKPIESTRASVSIESSTSSSISLETLPTLPPNRHFKRPGSSEPLDKDKIRKRNKIRRRRPIGSRLKEETSPRPTLQSSEIPQTTEADEVHTIRPRIRPTYQPNTTPTVTTDSTTSGLPTITPTTPGLIKKKLLHRRPITTTERAETTTSVAYKEDSNKESSSIMKITSRPQFPKITPTVYEAPDFSHKQDEKDTPTSDVTVSLSDSYKNSVRNVQEFSFHKDVKPIEAKLEPITNQRYKETTEQSSETDTIAEATTTNRPETTSAVENAQRPRLRNKYNRPKFSAKDYRNRMGSTTTTTEKPAENTPKLRYPHRRIPYNENLNTETETTTEKKRFTPKDPRHKPNETDLNEEKEKEIHSIRQHSRQRQTTSAEGVESTTLKISARIRNGLRRPRPTEETIETTSQPTVHRRPLRKKVKDSEISESVQDFAVTETTPYEVKNEYTSERTKSESAIMKIADKKHHEQAENIFEHSKRVSDLTLAASKDYSKPGMFKTLGTNSRRIPNYFTIATEDPILPIEAFFPQLNQKKDS